MLPYIDFLLFPSTSSPFLSLPPMIRHLPQHLINKLKAGEIVERPSSIVKELIENSLDAGATTMKIWIEDGGKTLIKVQDNGTGINEHDLPLSIARYATSKIAEEQDLEHLRSYGFRGEALAAIAEVSTCMLQTRTKTMPSWVGYELLWRGDQILIKPLQMAEEHGTTVIITDLFSTVPVRQKFLKSWTTEWYHIRQLLLNYLILHWDKERTIWHQGKIIWKVAPTETMVERIVDLCQDERRNHLSVFTVPFAHGELFGVIGDASLHFPSAEQMRFFVNKRPVEDKIIKKAVMQSINRQMPAGLFPFAYIFVDIDPQHVDVNVHPRKSEVKFLDPWGMFSVVLQAIQQELWQQKVSYAAFTKDPVHSSQSSFSSKLKRPFPTEFVKQSTWFTYHHGADTELFSMIQDEIMEVTIADEQVIVIWQLRQTYILASSETWLYLIDQHALAERIAFEQMKNTVAKNWFSPTILLQPVIVSLPSKEIESESRSALFARIGMDVSSFWPWKIIVHSVPQVFADWQMDIDLLINHLRGQQERRLSDIDLSAPEQLFTVIIEEMLGMKACKASITAWQSLTLPEMRQLLRDGQSVIPQLFVCQHGRPSIVKMPKSAIEKMVWR